MEKEIKNLENSQAEKVSGGRRARLPGVKYDDIKEYYERKCPKCGRKMEYTPGYATLYSSCCERFYCSHCDSKESGKDGGSTKN